MLSQLQSYELSTPTEYLSGLSFSFTLQIVGMYYPIAWHYPKLFFHIFKLSQIFFVWLNYSTTI